MHAEINIPWQVHVFLMLSLHNSSFQMLKAFWLSVLDLW